LGSTAIDAGDYDQSCSSNLGCVVVDDGDVCGVCNCGNAAINASAEEAYAARYDELRGACGPAPAIACDCERRIAYCAGEGVCEVRSAVERVPNEFDRSCQVDEDCVAVTSGEVCNVCACPDAAINVGAKADWDARADGVDCGISAAACAECEASVVACVNDVCVIAE
jgi:hypothetical protein